MELIIYIFVLLRKIGVWLGLIEKPTESSPHVSAVAQRPDGRAVPTLVVDDKKPPLPPPARFSGLDGAMARESSPRVRAMPVQAD